MLTKASFAIEFGPHPVVSGMIRATLGFDITVLPTFRRNTDPWEVLTKSLCSLKVIDLPAYNWDLKSFWIPDRNDWTLTKGDIPVHQCRVAAELDKSIPSTSSFNIAQSAIVETPKLKSSAIHEVLEERITSNGYEVVTECDVNRADVRPFIRGHTVDGFSLCTPERGSEIGQLSTFSMKFINKSDSQDFSQKLPNMLEHLERMRRQLTEGKTCRFSGPMAYGLVSALAEFSLDHYCVDEALYDNELYECIQVVSFGQMKKGGIFHINPGLIDGLTQLGGFTMNANDKTKLDTTVLANHDWKNLQLFEAIGDGCQYFAHVRMTPGDKVLWEGDVTIFTDDRIVGLVEGIQEVPRRLLKFILTQAAKPPKFKTKSAKETRSIPSRREEELLI
ncbi:Non-reducing polyketide synthase fsr1 [Metarhizium brunneum]|uniref:Non-reducing polyketide synthase fsr1 n=1 Tax=Metarhizium brunneum TaxID=500148 RepID=A0A7D5UWK0_9HYPO|nr:Non-reducing polyketide synthase fsr1 [Metarhizium brunneum]